MISLGIIGEWFAITIGITFIVHILNKKKLSMKKAIIAIAAVGIMMVSFSSCVVVGHPHHHHHHWHHGY